ncbi:hypothetical protein ACH5RR_005166 [Cinchona calisaya]|uniref:Uncharacterized protein n=1 Tax=Cinchona calisaya TaxID=153742 RepID=A0ABD3AKD6_9GENT
MGVSVSASLVLLLLLPLMFCYCISYACRVLCQLKNDLSGFLMAVDLFIFLCSGADLLPPLKKRKSQPGIGDPRMAVTSSQSGPLDFLRINLIIESVSRKSHNMLP